MSFSTIWNHIPLVRRACNALTIGTPKYHVTFWQRAMAATGRIEAYRSPWGLYASATVWGYMVSVEAKLPKKPDGYHRSLLCVQLGNWAFYSRKSPRLSWRSRLAVRALTWVMQQPGAMALIASEVEASGDFCRLISNAVEFHVDQLDLTDVDTKIADAFEEHERNFEVDADSVKGLEDAVREIMLGGSSDFIDTLTEEVVEHISRRLNR